MLGGYFLNAKEISDLIGLVCWTFMAIPGAILTWSAIAEAIIAWRWKRAWHRGEIKPRSFEPEKLERAVYR